MDEKEPRWVRDAPLAQAVALRQLAQEHQLERVPVVAPLVRYSQVRQEAQSRAALAPREDHRAALARASERHLLQAALAVVADAALAQRHVADAELEAVLAHLVPPALEQPRQQQQWHLALEREPRH